MVRDGTPAVFVAHTPFQLFVAHMLAESPDYARQKKFLVTDTVAEQCGLEEDVWDEIARLGPAFIERGTLHRYKEAYAEIRPLLSRWVGDWPVLAVANLEHPLSNAAYALLRRRQGFRLHVFPEGLANLTPTQWTLRRAINLLGKWTFTRMLGAPFITVGADLTGSHRAERIYSLAPELLPQYLRERSVRWLPRLELPPAEPGVLVLGQDLERFMSRQRAERELLALLEFVRNNTEGHQLYKPHHHESLWGRELARSIGFEIIESSCPTELWLRAHPVKQVASFGSSALVHVRLLYAGQISAIAFRPQVLLSVPGTTHSRLGQILRVFEQVGVKVVLDHSPISTRVNRMGATGGSGSSQS